VAAETLRAAWWAGLTLGLFALAGVSLVGASFEATRERIAGNERASLLRSLHALVPAEEHDNDMAADMTQVSDPALGPEGPQRAYRARRAGAPVALVLTAVAPDGYSGDIGLLVGIRYDGTVAGVRVTYHRETPGLGDRMEERRSPWIHGFAGRSLQGPPPERWAVKRDGGVFDQFTGATITPRAVVRAVRRALEYYAAHRDQLFAVAGAQGGET
jgi:electron transport complex protein RnfG